MDNLCHRQDYSQLQEGMAASKPCSLTDAFHGVEAGPCVSRRQPTDEPSKMEETRIRLSLSQELNTLTKTVTVAKKQAQEVALAKILDREACSRESGGPLSYSLLKFPSPPTIVEERAASGLWLVSGLNIINSSRTFSSTTKKHIQIFSLKQLQPQ